MGGWADWDPCPQYPLVHLLGVDCEGSGFVGAVAVDVLRRRVVYRTRNDNPLERAIVCVQNAL